MPTQSLSISLIGSWLNISLYSMEITLGADFLLHHKHNRFQKFSVGGSLFLDTACTIVVCYSTWVHTDASLKARSGWRPGVLILLTYLVSTLEKLYLIHQYWIIARNKTVLSVVLLGAAVHLIFASIASIYVLVVGPQYHRSMYTPAITSVTIAACICAATDLLIAINMFQAARKIDTIDTSTQSLLYRLSILAISSGVLIATVTILMVIFRFTSKDGFSFVFNLLGRIYTLTTVVNCIALKRHRNTSASISAVNDSNVPAPTASRTPGSVALTPTNRQTCTIPEDDSASSRVTKSVVRNTDVEIRSDVD
ncbi:hypothetical protein L218DRAFT_908666 [Marasmius fiardii PR-910]|nr:hypothetical protein L218DRAFT_908666 [Marasmius fiardii PR-910]